MSLTGKTLAGSYKDLLQMDNSNNGISGTTKKIVDGEGTVAALSISDDVVGVQPVNDNTVATFIVANSSAEALFSVNTHETQVIALGNQVNTQYANFGVTNAQAQSFADDTHQAIPFNSQLMAASTYPPAFGTSTDPATTFTTAEANGTRASDLVPIMWLVPDAISIDSVTSIEGADTATGDVSRMHLFSYTFASGSTSALSSGTLLAHNSDVTNAGSEQAYKTSWTVDSAAVASGKVILAFLKSDSISSDYSISVVVKYHLT